MNGPGRSSSPRSARRGLAGRRRGACLRRLRARSSRPADRRRRPRRRGRPWSLPAGRASWRSGWRRTCPSCGRPRGEGLSPRAAGATGRARAPARGAAACPRRGRRRCTCRPASCRTLWASTGSNRAASCSAPISSPTARSPPSSSRTSAARPARPRAEAPACLGAGPARALRRPARRRPGRLAASPRAKAFWKAKFQRRTRATLNWMTRKLTQRELRNNSGEVMRALDEGEDFIVTRNGKPVGELRPYKRRQFVPTKQYHRCLQKRSPSIDYEEFRADIDRLRRSGPYASLLGCLKIAALLDTSVAVRSSDRSIRDRFPTEIAISTLTLAELTAGPLAATDELERARRQRIFRTSRRTSKPLRSSPSLRSRLRSHLRVGR